MRVRVEAYAGYQGAERPLRFFLAGHELNVEEVLDRWYGPDYTYFKVRASDGHVYILRHARYEQQDFWELKAFFGSEMTCGGTMGGWNDNECGHA